MKMWRGPELVDVNQGENKKVKCVVCSTEFRFSPYNQNEKCKKCFDRHVLEILALSNGLTLTTKEQNEFQHIQAVDEYRSRLRGDDE